MSEVLIKSIAQQRTMDNVLEVITIPAPGAGNQLVFNFPGDRVWRIRSILASYTTSAVVANRQPALTLKRGTDVVLAVPQGITVPASSAVFVSWSLYGPQAGAVTPFGVVATPLPEIIIPGGWTFSTLVSAGDVGDAWGQFNIMADSTLIQPTGTHEYRDALELAERYETSPFLGGSQ